MGVLQQKEEEKEPAIGKPREVRLRMGSGVRAQQHSPSTATVQSERRKRNRGNRNMIIAMGIYVCVHRVTKRKISGTIPK